LAVTSQSGVQFDRRKPVIQGEPAGEILSGSPGTGYGRDEAQPDVSFLYGRLDRPVYGTEFELA